MERVEAVFYKKINPGDLLNIDLSVQTTGGGQTYLDLAGIDEDELVSFLSYGKIVERPENNNACRTQIKIEIPENDIDKLKNNPLGNHHLIIPGNHTELIKYFLKLVNIELV